MLFLTDVNHVSYGKANETRQINLPSATASLQVVIGLCKRKETAALKFKAAASYRRVDRTAVRRLFFFCRRPAEESHILSGNRIEMLSFPFSKLAVIVPFICSINILAMDKPSPVDFLAVSTV